MRKEAEACDHFQGFILTHAVSGGTGSGLATLLLERLSVDYGKKDKFSFTLYPSPKISQLTVEPFNTVLSTHSLLEHVDLTVMMDNEALYRIYQREEDEEEPTYADINRQIA